MFGATRPWPPLAGTWPTILITTASAFERATTFDHALGQALLGDWQPQRAFYISVLVGTLATLAALWLFFRQYQRKLHYRELFEKAPDAIFIQLERRFDSLNEACVRLFGASSPGEIIGQPILSRFHPDYHARITARIDALNQARQAVGVLEEEVLTLTGEVIPVEVSAVPFRHSGKNGALVFMRDIRARRAAEEALQRERVIMAQAEAAANMGSWQWDLASNEVRWSHQLYCIFGVPPETPAPPLDRQSPFFPPEDLARLQDATTKAVSDGTPYEVEMRYRHASGEMRLGVSRGLAERDPDTGKVTKLYGYFQDVTEHRRAESERDRLLVALEELAEVIFITNQDGSIVFVNDAFEEVTGYSRAEALGKNPRLLQSGAQGREFYDRLWKTLHAEHVWRGRIINRRKDGQLYTAEMAIAPVRSSPDEPAVYVAVQRDVTAELKLQAQYQQAQKMESVGRLAGGIAHDFNNMLGVIMGHAELALTSIERNNPLRSDLQEIFEAASRAAGITRQLLAFARQQTIAPAVLDLNTTIEGTLKMLRRLIGEDIDLLWKPSSDLWPVKMDPAQIDQILANLCVNARDAIEGNGKVTIETANVTFDDAYCADHAGFTPGDFVMMAVSDDGIGMEKETLALIFEPFFTTKDRERGTGLGLATVYGIVKQNGGFINVYSEPGEGTTFRIYLARAVEATGAVRTTAAVAAARGHGETILVVEDESAVLRFAERALNSLGYQVLVAEGPRAALELAHVHMGSIDLLLTDVVMPEINGRDLAARIAVLRPGIKVLFMSGYTPNVITHRGVLEDGIRYLPKPFSIAQLANKVRETLDQAP